MEKERIKKMAKNNMVIVFLVLLCLTFCLATSTFLTMRNIMNLISQMCINALLASGLTFVIILGGIDIAVGSTAAFAGVIAAMVGLVLPLNNFIAAVVLIVVAIIVGGLAGLFTGVMVTKLHVVPMICTLAMMVILRGLTYVVTGGTAVYGLPSSFSMLGAGRLFHSETYPNGIFPIIVIFTVIVISAMHILLSKTVFGRHVYASGSNPEVARLSGINVDKVNIISYTLCGITAAFGGVLVASKLQNGQPAACTGYEMYAIASTVLGGTSLTGGSGSVGRAMYGCAIIAVINNGMNLMHISSYWQQVVVGLIILLAVIVDLNSKIKKD
ncbi:MAG: ABC transporter permease [Sphaerochaetaceae bacterium]